MNIPLLEFTEKIIFSLKSGRSLSSAIKEFQALHPDFFNENELNLSQDIRKIETSSMSYELVLILKRGSEGLPIVKSLESFHIRAYEKVDQMIELKSKKAPFTALIPLFLFQVPSLCLLFFYPLICEFLSEAI